MKNETHHMGRDGYFHWVGVVEDRRDPLMLGRLRVRVLGCHTEDKSLIPTCELLWAYPHQTIYSQAMNGLGHSPTGIAEGTWVYGFFRDSDAAQDPVILGSIAGIPEEAPKPCVGFYDPSSPFHDLGNAPRKIWSRFYPNDGTGAQLKNESSAKVYPRKVHPWGCVVGENDVNRLARGEIDDTILGVKKRQRDVKVPIAFMHPSKERMWSEPESPAEPKYPYNHVYESESGHVIEVDDTPNKERLHLYHRSGTFIEIYGDPGIEGDFVMKVVGKRFEVTMENSYSHFQNAMNLTVDGEVNVYCRSDVNMQVDGNMKLHVKGNLEEKIEGNYSQHVKGNREVVTDGNDDHHIKGNETIRVEGDISHHTKASANYASGSTFKISSGATLRLDASGNIDEAGSNIHLNSRGASPTNPGTVNPASVPEFPEPIGREEYGGDSGPDPELEEKSDSGFCCCCYSHNFSNINCSCHNNTECVCRTNNDNLHSTHCLCKCNTKYENTNYNCTCTNECVCGSRTESDTCPGQKVDEVPPPYVEPPLKPLVGQQKVIKFDTPDTPTPQSHIDDLKKDELYVPPPTAPPKQKDETPPPPTPPTKDPPSCAAFAKMTSFPASLQLSPNFTLGDVSVNTAVSKVNVRAQHGLSIDQIVCNLQALCINILEPVAAKVGRRKMIITSGFRNDTGGKSQHERGQAADIQFVGLSNQGYYDTATDFKNSLPYDQLILEYMAPRPWIHLSYNKTGVERRQVLTAPSQGVYKPGLFNMRP